MELHHLRTFVAVARAGGVTEAAARLDLAPSSVSARIRALEDSLGVALFDRTPGGMRLTGAGGRLLDGAEGLLTLADEVRRNVVEAPEEIRIGALETLVAEHVPAIVARLAERAPGTRVEALPYRRRDLMLTDVLASTVDAALLLDTGDTLGGLGFSVPGSPDDLEVAEVERVPLVLVTAADHPLPADGTVPLERGRLSAERIVVTPPGCSFRLAADRFLGTDGDRSEVESVAIARAWAAQGVGMALLPEFAVATDLAAGVLARVPVAEPPSLTLCLVWRTDRGDEPALREALYAAAHRFTDR